jgi:hypothetical protein
MFFTLPERQPAFNEAVNCKYSLVFEICKSIA